MKRKSKPKSQMESKSAESIESTDLNSAIEIELESESESICDFPESLTRRVLTVRPGERIEFAGYAVTVLSHGSGRVRLQVEQLPPEPLPPVSAMLGREPVGPG